MKIKLFLIFFLVVNGCTLYGQDKEIYIPYRLNDKWGFADTLGNIIVTPRHQEVINYGYDKFVVKNENKTGVMNSGDTLVLEGDFDKVSLFEGLILTTKSDGYRNYNYELHSEKGKLLLRNYSNRISATGNLLTVGSETGTGILLLNKNKTEIEKVLLDTIYSKVYCFRIDSIVVFQGPLKIIYSLEKDTLIKINESNIISGEEEVEFWSNQGDTRKGRANKKKRKIWNSNLSECKFGKNKKLVVYKELYRVDKKIDTISTEFKSVQIFKRDRRRFYKRDSILFAEEGIRIKNWAIVSNLTNKFGIINGDGEHIIPCEYDSIRAREIPQRSKQKRAQYLPYYECMKNGKWGIIDANQNIILNFEYDSILISETDFNQVVFLDYGIIVIKNGKYGITKIGGKTILPCEMDLIVDKPRKAIFAITKNKLYGAYKYVPKHEEYFKPIFSFEIDRISYKKKYCIAHLVDNKENFLGYADKKGLMYFKDSKK